MENPIKMDDLGVPLFLETPMSSFQNFKAPVNVAIRESNHSHMGIFTEPNTPVSIFFQM